MNPKRVSFPPFPHLNSRLEYYGPSHPWGQFKKGSIRYFSTTEYQELYVVLFGDTMLPFSPTGFLRGCHPPCNPQFPPSMYTYQHFIPLIFYLNTELHIYIQLCSFIIQIVLLSNFETVLFQWRGQGGAITQDVSAMEGGYKVLGGYFFVPTYF